MPTALHLVVRLLRHSAAQLLTVLLLATALTVLASTGARADEPDETLARARNAHAMAEATSDEISELLSEARRGGHSRWERCLDGTLSRANALVRMIAHRFAELRTAVERGDAEAAARLARSIDTLASQIEPVRMDAWTCAGDPVVVHEGDVEIRVDRVRRRRPR